MDKNLVYAISVIACALLQLAIAPAVALFGATPNFLIIPVLFIALRSGAVAASVAGFALGLLYDFAGDGVIGAMALAFVLTGLAAGLLGANMEVGPMMAAVLGIVFSVVAALVFGLATALGSSAAGSVRPGGVGRVAGVGVLGIGPLSARGRWRVNFCVTTPRAPPPGAHPAAPI